MNALFLLMALFFGAPAHAQDDDAAYQSQRDEFANDNFNTIMQMNEVPARARMASPAAALNNAVSPAAAPPTAFSAPPSATAEVPLAAWEAARDRLAAARDRDAGDGAPLVVLGASSYTGRAIDGALDLQLELRVTLSGDDVYKTVPLVGEQVVVEAATADGRPIALSNRNGYHVWITKQTGEITLTLQLLVPSRGRRGSLEYDFLVAKTPVTQFDCTFPTAGLEPRLRGAVHGEVQALPGATRLTSWLEPTSRVHVVGFRDLGEDSGRTARLYAETLDLLSIGEGAHELFTVIRYNILYAGAKQFDVLVPLGWTVVSANGEGAFRYELEPSAEGTMIRGETAFPIRNSYEISLRLRRDPSQTDSTFDVALPRCSGVEREYGWLAVEVTGNVRVEEVAREEALGVDVRQLPAEIATSAVSPILRAYRYHTHGARVQLSAEPLPEKEPSRASIDRVEATTVVSPEGRSLTDLSITLRNRSRHSLALTLPDGASVRSALMDGQPIKPTIRGDGALLLPLKRSEGGRPFTLQVVFESEPEPFGWLGQRTLGLPSLELPAASVSWTAYLPDAYNTFWVRGGLEGQRFAGNGRWYEPPAGANRGGEANYAQASAGDSTATMPVRIDVPRSGKALTNQRYWVATQDPITLSFGYVSSGLRIPAGLLGLLWMAAATFAALSALAARRPSSGTRRLWVSAVALLGLAGATSWLAGPFAVTVGVLGGVGLVAWRRAWFGAAIGGVRAWWTRPAAALPESDDADDIREEGAAPAAPPTRAPLSQLGLVLGGVIAAGMAAILGMRVLGQALGWLFG